jgi:hypothetical protein
MKPYANSFEPYRKTTLLLFWLACFCGLIFPAPAVGEKSVADEIISLDVADKPLGEVADSKSMPFGKIIPSPHLSKMNRCTGF